MKIIELRAENFKRLTAVRIRPDGSLFQIGGRNAQGKSSVLDAIAAALGGMEAVPGKPIRAGAERASVMVDLGEIRVTRKFSGERSTLVVESGEGLTHKSPQTILDKLVGRLSFDPLAFARMPEAQQAQTLRELGGVDTRKLDAIRAETYAERTDVNRQAKQLRVQVATMPDVEAPEAELSLAELAAEHKAATDQLRRNADVRRKAEGWRATVERHTATVARLEGELEAARAELAEAIENTDKLAAAVAGLVEPDVDAIAARMAEAERVNTAVRLRKARLAKLAEAEERERAAAELTAKIEKIDSEKAAALAAAKLPVPGLAVDGDTVTLHGVPFDQASSAEKIRAGLAIGAALNPKLRVILVRDGSLLDEDGLRLVAEWAEANDMQVLLERVGGGAGVGVIIEDGEVVEEAAGAAAGVH